MDFPDSRLASTDFQSSRENWTIWLRWVGRNARSSKSLFSTSANFTTFPISLGCVWRQQIISFSKDLTTLVPCTNSDRFSLCRRGLWTQALVFRLVLISYSTLYSDVRQSKHVWNSTTVCRGHHRKKWQRPTSSQHSAEIKSCFCYLNRRGVEVRRERDANTHTGNRWWK